MLHGLILNLGLQVIPRKLVQVVTPSTTTDGNIGPDAVHLLAIKEVCNALIFYFLFLNVHAKYAFCNFLAIPCIPCPKSNCVRFKPSVMSLVLQFT